MTIREQNLDTISPVLVSFGIHQTAGVDDLKDANIGEAVTITGNNEVGPAGDGDMVLGKLVKLSLSDIDTGKRVASVQVTGTCRLAISAPYPTVGDRIVGAATGTVKQAPALASSDPAGGNVARGIVLAVNDTTDCIVLLD